MTVAVLTLAPWAALGSFGQPWAALGSLGQPWAALGSLGQPWAALGSLGQLNYKSYRLFCQSSQCSKISFRINLTKDPKSNFANKPNLLCPKRHFMSATLAVITLAPWAV
jgi:hypothetical protein